MVILHGPPPPKPAPPGLTLSELYSPGALFSWPELQAMASDGVLTQLESAIAGLRDDLAKAEKAGDERKIKAAKEALEAREAWLEQLERSASELS